MLTKLLDWLANRVPLNIDWQTSLTEYQFSKPLVTHHHNHPDGEDCRDGCYILVRQMSEPIWTQGWNQGAKK